MKHIRTNINDFLKEYASSPITMTKDEIGMGINAGDSLMINTRSGSDAYYFDYIEGNEIHVKGNFDDEDIVFDLDKLGSEWTITAINDLEVIVESKKN